MIENDRVQRAADELLAAAILGEGWENSLQQLADAAEAGGATLTRLLSGRPAAALSSSAWAEAEVALITATALFSPRQVFPEHVFGCGFVGDTDIWADEELRRDPYFQEFQRPRGVFYRAKARLLDGPDERLSLVLRRLAKFGPYEPTEIAALNEIVPKLQMAVGIARSVLESEASGMVRVLEQRGDPIFELDAFGRVLQARSDDIAELGIVVRDKRLLACERPAQAALDRAIATAVGPPHQPGLVTVANRSGDRRFLHVVPVTGRARDVFMATAAIVLIIEPGRTKRAFPALAIRQALGLTRREAQIAALLAEGLGLPKIAERLRIGLGTLRNHLKSIFAKTGTSRQGELIALLRSLEG